MPTVDNGSPCLLLDKLPFELRVEIYRHLVGSYTRSELKMKSKECDLNRDSILDGPDHVYKFHPAILGTSKRIREEAMDVLGRENRFIHLSTREWHLWQLWGSGFSILAAGAQARFFPKIAMTLILDSAQRLGDWQWDRKERSRIVFTIDDLPAVIAMLSHKIASLRSPALYVSINGAMLGSASRHSSLETIVKSLQQLRGLDLVKIDGLKPQDNKHDIIATMCGRKRAAKEIMHEVAVSFDRGGEARENNDDAKAVSEYKTALYTVRGSSLDVEEEHEVLSGGQFNGIWASWARDDAEIRLHSLIATAYLRLGRNRMARIYVERIYGPLHSYDNRHNKEKFPLRIESGNPSVYAELLAVAAQISWGNGDLSGVLKELSEAERLDPWSLDLRRLQRDYQYHYDKVREKRRLGLETQQEKQEKRDKATMQVTRN